jgi:hypothetical protein
MRNLFSAGLAIALAAPFAAAADTASDIQALRQEMEATRSNYEQRLQVLEQRLKAAEAAAQAPAAASVAAASPTPAAPVPGTRGGANAFNPEIIADPVGPVHAHVQGPGELFAERFSPSTRRRSGAGHARIQPLRKRARLRREYRSVVARLGRHRDRA